MKTEHQIIEQICAAQSDSQAADKFIRQYMGFIRAETAKFMHRIPVEGQDDELSIAMLAFYEALLSYNKLRGNFLYYAGRGIKNRLIDFYRKEKRHLHLSSLDESSGEDEDGALIDRLPDGEGNVSEHAARTATQEEIQEFGNQLALFGLSFSDTADNCPKQERTLRACYQVLSFAKQTPELLDQLLQTKKLPVSELAKGSGVERKTIERHRKYLVTILLAYTNGYEIIRRHLHQVAPKKGGDQ